MGLKEFLDSSIQQVNVVKTFLMKSGSISCPKLIIFVVDNYQFVWFVFLCYKVGLQGNAWALEKYLWESEWMGSSWLIIYETTFKNVELFIFCLFSEVI